MNNCILFLKTGSLFTRIIGIFLTLLYRFIISFFCESKINNHFKWRYKFTHNFFVHMFYNDDIVHGCNDLRVVFPDLYRRRMHGTFNQSQLDFEQWSKAQRDRAQVEIEMQTQKKRMYKEVPPFKIPPREIPSSYLEPKNVGIQTIPEELEQLTLKNWVPSNGSASIPVMAS